MSDVLADYEAALLRFTEPNETALEPYADALAAEVTRLREDAAGWRALAGRRRATGQKMLTELEQMVPAIKALEEEAKTARRDALLEAAVSAFGPETRTEDVDGWWRVLIAQGPGVAGGGANECAALINALNHAGEMFRALAGDKP